jgi:hypothetical protein
VGAVPPTSLALAPRAPRPVTGLDGLPNRPEHYEQEPDKRDGKENHVRRLAARAPAHGRRDDQVGVEASFLLRLDHGRDEHVFSLASADPVARLPLPALRNEGAKIGSVSVDKSVAKGHRKVNAEGGVTVSAPL